MWWNTTKRPGALQGKKNQACGSVSNRRDPLGGFPFDFPSSQPKRVPFKITRNPGFFGQSERLELKDLRQLPTGCHELHLVGVTADREGEAMKQLADVVAQPPVAASEDLHQHGAGKLLSCKLKNPARGVEPATKPPKW